MLRVDEEIDDVWINNRHSMVCVYMYPNEHKQEGGGGVNDKKARTCKKYGKVK